MRRITGKMQRNVGRRPHLWAIGLVSLLVANTPADALDEGEPPIVVVDVDDDGVPVVAPVSDIYGEESARQRIDEATAGRRAEAFRQWIRSQANDGESKGQVISWGGSVLNEHPMSPDVAFTALVRREETETWSTVPLCSGDLYFELVDGSRWQRPEEGEYRAPDDCTPQTEAPPWTTEVTADYTMDWSPGWGEHDTDAYAFVAGVPTVLSKSVTAMRPGLFGDFREDWSGCDGSRQSTQEVMITDDGGNEKTIEEEDSDEWLPFGCPMPGDLPILVRDEKGREFHPWNMPLEEPETVTLSGDSSISIQAHVEEEDGNTMLVVALPEMDALWSDSAGLKHLNRFDHFEVWAKTDAENDELRRATIVLDRKQHLRCVANMKWPDCQADLQLIQDGRAFKMKLSDGLVTAPDEPDGPWDRATVVFSDGDGKKRLGRVATSKLSEKEPNSLGRIYQRHWRWKIDSQAIRVEPAPGTFATSRPKQAPSEER